METLWFSIVAAMLATYVVLDGFDLGAGILHRFVARTDAERGDALRSIGPIWDGNEVWLVASAATLLFAFPLLYATAFSGFYLPLMLVLWLLVGRACAIELRHQVESPVWRSFWDTIFQVSSVLLTVCFGAALGSVVRGVPLAEDGTFFHGLWGDGRGGTGVLDPFTLLVAATALAAVGLQGAVWLAWKLEGDVELRATRAGRRLALAALVLDVAVTLAAFAVQPHLGARIREAPLGLAFGVLSAAGLVVAFLALRRGRAYAAVLGSSAHLAGLLGATAFGLFPYVLPSTTSVAGLTARSAAAAPPTLSNALVWFVPGIALAILYQVIVYRRFSGKVRPDASHG